TEVTPELHREGLVREVISHVQGVRRDLDLGYTQRIRLFIEVSGELAQAVQEHSEHLKSEILAEELVLDTSGVDDVREIEIEGQSVRISVEAL
ncbi:MAG: DUF5915 domain-containing protein, partial [Planctomycetota bacterium]|nr:DUF5915 domain-containing protein [Planctomycetota bacterium]